MLRILLFFQLLYVVNQIHFHWETGIPAVAPANLIMLLTLLLMRTQEETVTARPMLLKPFLYFFGALTFAFLWAQVRGVQDFVADATYYKNALFFPLFYFMYLKCRQDEKTTRWLILWIMVIAAIAGLEAIREGFAFGFGKYNPFRRASGPFGEDWHNANRAGVFYAMFTPMFMSLALFLRRQKILRLAAIGGLGLITAGALFTYSRQAYFIILLGVAVLLLRKSIVLTVVLSVALVSMIGFLPDAVTQRVDETKQTTKSGREEIDTSTASRWEIWGGAMGMLAEHPIGVGLHRFTKEIGNYCSHKGYDAHNFYVLTLAEAGPQGLATFLFLLWTIFRLAKFLRQNTPPDDPEANALTLGFTVCTICMCLGGLYGSPHFEGAVMAPYWALCGLLERYIHLRLQSGGGAQEKPQVKVEASLAERFPLAAHITPGKR